MKLLKLISLTILLGVTALSAQANDSISLSSDTGDTLMIHRLSNGEIWGSFIITDQVVDSFSASELIVLQVDQHKPIKLDHEKRCGTPAGEAQKVDYVFQTEQATDQQWQFSQVESAQSNILKLTGWDKEFYHHMKSDRRPNVVDFPIQGPIALESLWQQFQKGKQVIFHYTTDADEPREARFNLASEYEQIRHL
jgi:hypothetical protein